MERAEIVEELARFASRVGDSTLVVTKDAITLRVQFGDSQPGEGAQCACNKALSAQTWG